MKMQELFDPTMEYLSSLGSSALLNPPPVINVPANAPPQVAQQMWQQVANQLTVSQGPVLDCELFFAAIESKNGTSRYIRNVKIFGTRQADLNFLIGIPRVSEKWVA